MTDEKTERVAMMWPVSLKERVQEATGPRGLTKFTLAAVQAHLAGGQAVVAQAEGTQAELERQLNETRHMVQLLADRIVMGGDDEDRFAALMEVEFPHWLDTAGWPAHFADRVRPPALSTPVEKSVDSEPVVITEPAEKADGGRVDLFARVMERTGQPLEAGFGDLKVASDLEVPEKPPVEVHNHAWERTDGVLCCQCGAWIDDSDPAYPNGIVRASDWARDDGQSVEGVTVHENMEAFLEHLDKVAAEPIPPMPVTEPANAVAPPTVETLVVLCPNNCGDELIDGECWTCA